MTKRREYRKSHEMILKSNEYNAILILIGLDHIDVIKQWYLTQLIQNKLKLTNINKLKHQNLFSIDKMLTDLKQLSDLNSVLGDFLSQHKFQPLSVFASSSTLTASAGNSGGGISSSSTSSSSSSSSGHQEPPTYEDYVANYGLESFTQNDVELEAYLKEKQERIESLQNEKSSLIRKLLEVFFSYLF